MKQLQQDDFFFKSIKVSEAEIVFSIKESINSGGGKLVTYFNQNSFNEYHRNAKFRQALMGNFDVFSDGRGMSFALTILFGKKVEKFNATDLYFKLFNNFFSEKIPVYMIGGNFDINFLKERSIKKMILVGYSNGYSETKDIDKLIEKIESSGSRIIGIGMGTPLQEVLAREISLRLKNCIILCVGNFFNFYLGETKNAPVIIRNSGLEWIYRLIREPRKLWKRYLIGIPLFIVRIFKYKFS